MQAILLVDDNEIIRSVVAKFLRQKYQVLEASNGKEGLNTFKANASKVGIVITDFSMPIMSGFDMVKVIRTLSTEVKTMVLSASISNPKKLFRASAVKIDKFLLKPATLKDIGEAIKELIEG